MKRFCKWCLKVKIMIIEIASTGIFLAFVCSSQSIRTRERDTKGESGKV